MTQAITSSECHEVPGCLTEADLRSVERLSAPQKEHLDHCEACQSHLERALDIDSGEAQRAVLRAVRHAQRPPRSRLSSFAAACILLLMVISACLAIAASVRTQSLAHAVALEEERAQNAESELRRVSLDRQSLEERLERLRELAAQAKSELDSIRPDELKKVRDLVSQVASTRAEAGDIETESILVRLDDRNVALSVAPPALRIATAASAELCSKVLAREGADVARTLPSRKLVAQWIDPTQIDQYLCATMRPDERGQAPRNVLVEFRPAVQITDTRRLAATISK